MYRKLDILVFILFFGILGNFQNTNASTIECEFKLPNRMQSVIAGGLEHPRSAIDSGMDPISRHQQTFKNEQSNLIIKENIPTANQNMYINNYCCIDYSDLLNRVDDELKIVRHAFSVATLTLMYYEKIGEINLDSWQSLPLNFIFGNKGNTAFHPSQNAIFYYGTNFDDFEFDVIAHEVGHAVLHYLKPDFNFHQDPKINFMLSALHEAFADCTAIFSSLSIAAESQFSGEINNLFSDKTKMGAIAPAYSGNHFGLRNPTLQNINLYNQYFLNNNFHDFSQIVTGLLHGIIFEVCNYEASKNGSLSPITVSFERLWRAFCNSFISLEVI